MNNLRTALAEEINEVIERVKKVKNTELSEEIADILISEGFVQHKLISMYKLNQYDKEVDHMRLNKYIGQIYADNSERINELVEYEKATKIPETPMHQWFSEIIGEDLYNGVAPFKNTPENKKILVDELVEWDPMFDAIEFNLKEFYKHVEKTELIEPMSFVDKIVEEPRVEEEVEEEIIDSIIPDSIIEEPEEEYVQAPTYGFGYVPTDEINNHHQVQNIPIEEDHNEVDDEDNDTEYVESPFNIG